MSERFIDLSHNVRHGMITYKGMPGPIISEYLSREVSRGKYTGGTEFHIGRIDMVANTGTYIDSPFHRYAGGKDLSALPLASIANLEGVVVRPPKGIRSIGAKEFRGIAVHGKAVLVDTGWSRHFGHEEYFEGHPFLTRDAAEYLKEQKAALVGIDSFNIDDTADGQRPVHSILLASDIPVVEHLTNLAALAKSRFRFFAVPVKVESFGSFPVRAFALLE